mmetsp:Transcript_15417/g.43373  ORF Transcript_15417/g.43373 Transcript_15417/m.43373 type:complete len:594 (+) Transcript_15417:102-1883(+)
MMTQVQKKVHASHESAHTSVLGMDGSDLEMTHSHDSYNRDNNRSNAKTTGNSHSSGNKMTTTMTMGGGDEDTDSDIDAEMGAISSQAARVNASVTLDPSSSADSSDSKQRSWRPPTPTMTASSSRSGKQPPATGNDEQRKSSKKVTGASSAKTAPLTPASSDPDASVATASSWWKKTMMGKSSKTAAVPSSSSKPFASISDSTTTATAENDRVNGETFEDEIAAKTSSKGRKQQRKPPRQAESKQKYHSISTMASTDQTSQEPHDALRAQDSSQGPNTEDQLRQDCAFFYRGLEDGTDRPPNNASTTGSSPSSAQRNAGRRFRALLSRSSSGPFNTPYQLSGTVGDFLPAGSARRGFGDARFHANYQRLNQSLDFDPTTGGGNNSSSRNDRETMSDDLYLYDETNARRVLERHSSNFSEAQASTMVYEQNGRLLLRLPRDQVRLIMESDMEPGILSVEQWRKDDDSNNLKKSNRFAASPPPSMMMMRPIDVDDGTAQDGHDHLATYPTNYSSNNNSSSNNPMDASTPPQLSYVLSVPDDLYRRVVSEMSDALIGPSYKQCCQESERADIRFALGILAIILTLMFIGSLEWPTE